MAIRATNWGELREWIRDQITSRSGFLVRVQLTKSTGELIHDSGDGPCTDFSAIPGALGFSWIDADRAHAHAINSVAQDGDEWILKGEEGVHRITLTLSPLWESDTLEAAKVALADPGRPNRINSLRDMTDEILHSIRG